MNTYRIYEQAKSFFGEEQGRFLAGMLSDFHDELKNSVNKEDFSQLKGIVSELAEAQKRTGIKVEELAEAQKRTEGRLDSLTVKVSELADAQKRTEIKVEELAEAQKRTEIKVEELAEAQKRTEIELAQLSGNVKDLRSTVGGMQRTMSYALENEAYRKIPALVKSRFGFETQERIIRKYIGDVEINFLARGTLNGKPSLLVGESKHQIQKKNVNELIDQLNDHVALAQEEYGIENVLRLYVTHSAHDRAIEALKKEGVEVIQSYEWD